MSSYGHYGPAQAVFGDSSMTTAGISIDPELLKRIDRMERMMENIAERLSILDDPSPERLARHKMLKEAYMKYLFIEKLCQQEDEENES